MTVTASDGAVSAQLSYQEGVGGPLPYFDLALQISRSGTPYYQAPVSSPMCPMGCVPQAIGGGPLSKGPLAVADLEGNGQPAVLLGVSTGGAHCCTIMQVFSFDPGAMVYRPVEHDFGDPGAVLADLGGNGQLELRSADDRFAYEFAPYAYSGLPLQVWSFHEGRFQDTTGGFPAALAADAARELGYFRSTRSRGLGLGFIAAWAADEQLLGHGALVRSTLTREARLHRLRSRQRYAPSGSAFIAKLMRFLQHNGYG